MSNIPCQKALVTSYFEISCNCVGVILEIKGKVINGALEPLGVGRFILQQDRDCVYPRQKNILLGYSCYASSEHSPVWRFIIPEMHVFGIVNYILYMMLDIQYFSPQTFIINKVSPSY